MNGLVKPDPIPQKETLSSFFIDTEKLMNQLEQYQSYILSAISLFRYFDSINNLICVVGLLYILQGL